MTENPTRPQVRGQFREEAAEWLVTFSEGAADARAREAFSAWLRASPEHVRAYLRVSAFWEAADQLDLGLKRDIAELVRLAQLESNVFPLQQLQAPVSAVSSSPTPAGLLPAVRSPRRRKIRAFAIAASVGVLSVALTVWQLTQQTYTTSTGEQRTVTLTDGSTIELNARSRVTVRFSEHERDIELLEGQALFGVAHDATRPFIVSSNDTRIRAVGTRFDVDRKRTEVVVTVLEGKVSVAQGDQRAVVDRGATAGGGTPVLLASGQQVVTQKDQRAVVRQVDTAKVTAWREGLLVFDDARLSEVVEEFNRHNFKSLVISDPQLGELKISGVFPAAGSGRIMEFLHERFGITGQDSGDAIVIGRQ
jgi:transmembrane sensor